MTRRRAVEHAVANACADMLAAARAELNLTPAQIARLEARVRPIALELTAEIIATPTETEPHTWNPSSPSP